MIRLAYYFSAIVLLRNANRTEPGMGQRQDGTKYRQRRYKLISQQGQLVILCVGAFFLVGIRAILRIVMPQVYVHPLGFFFLTLYEVVAYGCLSLTITNLLVSRSPKPKRSYRLAVLVVGLLGFLVLIVSQLRQPNPRFFLSLVLLLMASFAGSFTASNLKRGWFENNAPPSEHVQEDVVRLHLPYMDKPKKMSILKRLLDILLSLLSILISTPIWLLLILMIWWEDPGPVLFVKNSVGRGGINFKQFKLRSMILDAENDTGPISGYENDERVLFFGKLIRKTALDELPQLVNILRGDMSYVGPRPQRTVLVHGYLQKWPDYAARHQVRPGLAGLAQVADSYAISPKEKLAWDLLYIEKLSLLLDIKLVLAAFLLVFVLRFGKQNNAELITRRLLGVVKPSLD